MWVFSSLLVFILEEIKKGVNDFSIKMLEVVVKKKPTF